MEFAKYQALGNDYVVVESSQLPPGGPAPALVRAVCERHFGVGADGLLVSDGTSPKAGFSLRILNPDGSEAEKSGNGLRIHARYLWDLGRVGDAPFEVSTRGGSVRCRVLDGGRRVRVEMGRVSFRSGEIPVSGAEREVLREALEVGGRRLEVSAATLGNPHCVVFCDRVSAALARELGPLLETHPAFPERTNVQLVQVLGRHAIRIEVWERGAGHTLASGSSACAAAAVSCRLGHCQSPLLVHMPGGELQVDLDAEFAVTQCGPVARVASGTLGRELLEGAAARGA